MSDLRARRHQETRDDILGAALRLFRSEGYGEVTIDRIAQAAGVSRRTVYRRFPSKEHVVLALPEGWLDVWDEAVAAEPADAPAREVAEAAALAVARQVDADAERILVVYDVLREAPWLESAVLANRAWSRRIVDLLLDPGRGPTPDERHARVLAGACLGAIDAMMALWAESGGRTQIEDDTKTVLATLRPLWPT